MYLCHQFSLSCKDHQRKKGFYIVDKSPGNDSKQVNTILCRLRQYKALEDEEQGAISTNHLLAEGIHLLLANAIPCLFQQYTGYVHLKTIKSHDISLYMLSFVHMLLLK